MGEGALAINRTVQKMLVFLVWIAVLWFSQICRRFGVCVALPNADNT